MKPRVVFDAMIHLQAAGRPAGPSHACYRLAEAGGAELCVSDEALAEERLTGAVSAVVIPRRQFHRQVDEPQLLVDAHLRPHPGVTCVLP